MSMAHKSGNSGSVLGGGFEYKIPVKSWNVGIKSGGKDGAFSLDDFLPFDPGVGGGYTLQTNTSVISNGSGFGEVELTTGNTAQDEAYLCAVSGGVGCLKFVAGKRCAAAIRFKIDQIAQSKSLFVGWMTDSQAVAQNMLVDSTGVVIGTVDGVGLQLIASASPVLRLIHGVSLAVPTTVHTAAAHTLVADTYVNFSLVFDGTDARFYIDGLQIGDEVARTSIVPADEPLRPVILVKTHHATTVVVTVDSIAGASER